MTQIWSEQRMWTFLSKDTQMANNHEKTVIREMQIYEIPPLIILTQMAITKNTTSVDWSLPPLLMGIKKKKQPRHSGNMVRHFLKELTHITWLSISTPRQNWKHVHTEPTCTWMFIVALFMIVKTWKPPNSLNN